MAAYRPLQRTPCWQRFLTPNKPHFPNRLVRVSDSAQTQHPPKRLGRKDVFGETKLSGDHGGNKG